MGSTIPDKPGTMIDPGFVSYTGTVLEVMLTESGLSGIVSPVSPVIKHKFTSGANGDKSTVLN